MDTLGGMTRTGEKIAGPASDLVELESDKGLKHLAITFHRKYRQHDSLHAGLRDIGGFLAKPDVCDMVEMVKFVPESGAFIYPTGSVISVAEILEVLSKMGDPGGVKAGLELCYLSAQVLQEAAEKGEPHGADTHGDISPWRLVCRTDGQVKLLGYGLAQVDMAVFREDSRAVPKEDGFRYCPPERIVGNAEDATSDLFSLALVAFELMVGEPLYNGLLAEIKQQALNAQGPYRLYQWREKLPESVVDFLTRALKFDMDARHADLNEFIWDVRDVLALPEIDGPSLTEVVGKVRHRLRRKRPLQGGVTDAMTPEELAEIANELDGPRKRHLPTPKGDRPSSEPEPEEGQRWGSVSRSGSRDSARPQADPARTSRDRLKGRLKRSGDSRASEPDSARSSLKDRLKRSRSPEEASGRASRSGSRDGGPERSLRRSRDASPVDPPPAKRSSSLLDRLRSSRDGAADAPAKASEPAAAPAGTSIMVSIAGAEPVSVSVAEGALVCDLIYAAVASLGGMPTSFTGVAQGWFRAEGDGEHLPGDDAVSELGGGPVSLVLQPAQLVPVAVDLRGDEPASFRTPVNTAMTAGAILGQILASLELSGDDWQISIEGQPLPRLQALGDAFLLLDDPGEVILVVET